MDVQNDMQERVLDSFRNSVCESLPTVLSTEEDLIKEEGAGLQQNNKNNHHDLNLE